MLRNISKWLERKVHYVDMIAIDRQMNPFRSLYLSGPFHECVKKHLFIDPAQKTGCCGNGYDPGKNKRRAPAVDHRLRISLRIRSCPFSGRIFIRRRSGFRLIW